MKFLVDPFTNEVFIPKRKNQLFANSKNKTSFHNEIARQERQSRKLIDSIINKNFKILKKIMVTSTKIEIKLDELLSKGFDFRVFNHHLVYEKNNYVGIYNFGYRKINEKSIEIIKIIRK